MADARCLWTVWQAGVVAEMFDDADWSVAEDVERVRRSVAMLTPGQWALQRDAAVTVLDALIEALRCGDASQGI